MDIQAPPDRYLPYTGPIAQIERPMARAALACRALGLQMHGPVFGCSLWASGACVIIVPNDQGDRIKREAVAHEEAHCNGWPANHPR